LALTLAAVALGQAQQVPVEERTLSNGMKLLMVERHHSPAVAGGWVARVGSVNERPGITGIAHLFEHMMFKGTPTIGTSDAKRDAEIIEQQEVVRDAMRREEAKMRLALRRGEIDDLAKPENKTERYRELEAQFDELIAVQRVAKRRLKLDQVIILVVGQKEEILKGHPDHSVKLGDLAKRGVSELPMRDPLTMKPLK